MAGAGYKLFNTGDVLTAAQVNTYLQEQVVMVFADATARTTALSGVLAEGMVSYLKDTNATEVYDGSAWVGIGNSGDITGVTAGTGISGGGTSGTVTITNDMATTITAAGDIVVGTGSGTYDNLPIGTTGQILTADTTVSPYKVKWATPASSTPTFVGCSLKASADQTISNTTYTAVAWNQEDFDTDAFHDNTTNNSRITIPSGKAGKYLISGFVAWDTDSNGTRELWIYKNGTQLKQVRYGATSKLNTEQITCVLDLVATDYVQLYVYQDSGTTRTMYGSNTQGQFSAALLGA